MATEYTEEQQEEILGLVKHVQEKEQWRIAADQFFREALVNTTLKVQQGYYDPYVVEVGKEIYGTFRKTNGFEQTKKGDDE